MWVKLHKSGWTEESRMLSNIMEKTDYQQIKARKESERNERARSSNEKRHW